MSRFLRIFPTASIGAYLVAMAAVVVLPLVAFVAFLMLQLEANERDILRRETAEDAQVLGRIIDRKLQDMATTLRLLAASPELQEGEYLSFHNRTRNILRSDSLYMIVADAEGQQLLNTRVAFGTPLGKISNLPALESALRSNRVEVSDIFLGELGPNWVFNVTLPLPEGHAPGAAGLILGQYASDLGVLITDEALPPEWSAVVLDAFGHVIASRGPEHMEVGSVFPQERLTRMVGYNGIIEEDGDEHLMFGYSQLPGWSWRVVVFGPVEAAQATIISAWRQLILGSLIFLSIGMLIAYAVARQLRIPIRQIADMADRIGKGEIVPPVSTRIVEANQIAVALSNASFERSEAEDRVHFILNELVHRTKNILTLVQAMMRQLARQGMPMDEFQKAVGARLQGLAKSIEALAREQWSGVSMRRLLEIHLDIFTDTAKRVEARGPDFTLKVEAVQNLGLVLHELATNSVKYGALSTPAGRIRIEWMDQQGKDGDDQVRIVWQEVGGPVVVAPKRTGFGTTIIKRHAAAAFSGSVEIEYHEAGLRWTLVAPRHAIKRDVADTHASAAHATVDH